MGNLTIVQKGERDLISDGEKGKWSLLLLAVWIFGFVLFCLLSVIVQWLDYMVIGWLYSPEDLRGGMAVFADHF